MKRTLTTLAAVFLVTLAAASRAENSNERPALYDGDLARARGSAETRAAVEGISKDCEILVMRRSGPRPEEVATCRRSVDRAVALGPSVEPDVLRKLNSQTGY